MSSTTPQTGATGEGSETALEAADRAAASARAMVAALTQAPAPADAVSQLLCRKLYDEDGRLRFMRSAPLADVIGRQITVGEVDDLLAPAAPHPAPGNPEGLIRGDRDGRVAGGLDELRRLSEAAHQGPLKGGHRCDGAIRAKLHGGSVLLGENIPAADAAFWAAACNYVRGHVLAAPQARDAGSARESAVGEGRVALRKALAAITDAADALILTLPAHWHDDATIGLTDAATDARAALSAAEQDDLYEPAHPGATPAGADLNGLAELSAKATAGEWSYRPHRHDDWGYIRGPQTDLELPGVVVAIARGDDPDTYPAHREAGTDPSEPNGRFIVALVNAYRSGHLAPAPAEAGGQGEADTDELDLAASERISAAQVAYDQAMEGYDPSEPEHEVRAFDAMKAAVRAADALATPRSAPPTGERETIDTLIRDWLGSVAVAWGEVDRRPLVDAILALALAPPQEAPGAAVGGGWEPIASAPRDGSDIMAYCSGTKEQFVVFYNNGGWQYAFYGPDDKAICCRPTHWHPLPAPPAHPDLTGQTGTVETGPASQSLTGEA